MEQIREIAMAYYRRSSAEEKERAHILFSSLDVDGDGRVSLAEYKNVFGSDKLFDVIDQNGDGTLDFVEVLTLYYMRRFGIRICDGCRDFLLGSYFSCALCEKDTTYDLCGACYGGGKFHHHHSMRLLLSRSMAALDDRSMRLLLSRNLEQPNNQPATPKPSSQRVAPPPVHQYNSRSSRAEKKTTFEAIHTIVSAGNNVYSIASTASTIVQFSGCIVM